MVDDRSHFEDMIKTYELLPLLPEGGFFKRIYPLKEHNEKHAGASSIYYMMSEDSFSSMHKLTGDEIWHFYNGDPVEQILIFPNGELKRLLLGADPSKGQLRMAVVPSGVWQGTRIKDSDNGYALCGCTVVPAYSDASYTHGEFSDLITLFPQHEAIIERYCYNKTEG